MNLFRNIQDVRHYLKQERLKAAREGKVLETGFVPTMGYLHEGHASLLREARRNNDLVVLSIFVNPIQFGPNEDFERYPRDEAKDLQLAEQEGVDAVFLPSVEEMYPAQTLTKITVSQQLTGGLCGASRPGHFDGVTTVVSKLFHIVEPERAYFGQKDAQQVAVISQMVKDLNMPVQIVPCPIVREEDGLALSSRNVYLAPAEREAALVLSRQLLQMQEQVNQGRVLTAGEAREALLLAFTAEPLAEVDYVEVVRFPDLQPLGDSERIALDGEILIAVAVKFGSTRLIDNVILSKRGV
ncbi:pantoate--beta-alanine ligase [Paenibacillus antibioticophila]|uniref:Pantothenate synthetase n=1 Tax=Paenibacillus antibioticophila TaxID=1274374 RepID=A0A919XPD6_9BACL|nr:pantoate--beta-alanine ligase [Paenibacillus antibioticophila]GIO36786.1 pantoate--beta-alanine ligase [Paenibacillus antibioticophila]